MKTVCEINKCNGCMACVSVCNKNCIKIIDSMENMNCIIGACGRKVGLCNA